MYSKSWTLRSQEVYSKSWTLKISGSCYLIMHCCYLCYFEFLYSSTCTCSHWHGAEQLMTSFRLSRLQNYHGGRFLQLRVALLELPVAWHLQAYIALHYVHCGITIFNHNLFVFNICAIFTNLAKQILWSRFSIDQGEFLTSIEAFLPRKQPPKIQTGL